MVLVLLGLLLGCPHHGAPEVLPTPSGATSAVPPAVRLVLEAGADDLDLDIRRAAIPTLARTSPEPAGGAWGRRGRYDPSPAVQRATITALAARAEPAADALLKEIAEDAAADGWVRGCAALAVIRRDGPANVAWAATLAARTPAAGAPGLLLAAGLAGDAASASRLAEWVAHGDIPLQLDLVAELGRLPTLAPSLALALLHAEPELQLPIAAALLPNDVPAARATLAGALHAPVAEQRLEALDALEGADPTAAAALLQDAANQPDDVVHTRARLILMARSGEANALVERSLDDPEREVRLAALAAIASLRARPAGRIDTRWSEPLRTLATDLDTGVALAAIHALGVQPSADDLHTLEGLLNEESLLVRVAAARAMSGAG